ncbi:MAG: monovalent cation/H+ antiporter subunit D, partial [Candidatus Competibacteraceae bacterium]|nr:monovalent cation/H+ antiporter subunit D [Candidatus Competibacteraceae bacterium]
AGFLGKWLTLRAALDHVWLPGIMSVVLGGALLSMIALARSGSLLFYPVDPEVDRAPETSLSRTLVEIAPVIGLLALVVGLTVGAGPIFEQAHAIAEQMLEPQRYIQAVLGPGGAF